MKNFGYNKIGSVLIPAQWRIRIFKPGGQKGRWIYNNEKDISYNFNQNSTYTVEISYNQTYNKK